MRVIALGFDKEKLGEPNAEVRLYPPEKPVLVHGAGRDAAR
ncbi:hypothetical protein [Actinomadura coerulea]